MAQTTTHEPVPQLKIADMSVMILAAGKGTRMGALTEHTPKPLVKLSGHALIDWHLHALACSGFTQVVINTAYLSEVLLAHFDEAKRTGQFSELQIQLSVEDEPLETAGGIVQALPLIESDYFLVINADAWLDLDLQAFALRALDKLKETGGSAYLGLVDNPEHNPSGDFYLDDQGAVSVLGERSGLTFSGCSVLKRELFEGLETGVRPLAPILKNVMGEGRCFGERLSGQWVDVGTPMRLEELTAAIAGGAASHHGAFNRLNLS